MMDAEQSATNKPLKTLTFQEIDAVSQNLAKALRRLEILEDRILKLENTLDMIQVGLRWNGVYV